MAKKNKQDRQQKQYKGKKEAKEFYEFANDLGSQQMQKKEQQVKNPTKKQ